MVLFSVNEYCIIHVHINDNVNVYGIISNLPVCLIFCYKLTFLGTWISKINMSFLEMKKASVRCGNERKKARNNSTRINCTKDVYTTTIIATTVIRFLQIIQWEQCQCMWLPSIRPSQTPTQNIKENLAKITYCFSGTDRKFILIFHNSRNVHQLITCFSYH